MVGTLYSYVVCRCVVVIQSSSGLGTSRARGPIFLDRDHEVDSERVARKHLYE